MGNSVVLTMECLISRQIHVCVGSSDAARLAFDYAIYLRYGNRKLECDFSRGFPRVILRAHHPDLFVSYFSRLRFFAGGKSFWMGSMTTAIALRHPTSFNRVEHIICRRSYKKMGWIATGLFVASVADNQSGGDIFFRQGVCHTMRKPILPTEPESTVSSFSMVVSR